MLAAGTQELLQLETAAKTLSFFPYWCVFASQYPTQVLSFLDAYPRPGRV
jgi:hypothetical protein